MAMVSRPTSSSSLPSLSHSSPSSSSSSLLDVPLALDRPNQHLAVLLPKHLWKPDSSSSTCDNFYCRVQFSLFERKHHCRKCGGVFCGACSSCSTPLLDTSNLPFLHPPRNVPLTEFESPISPIINSRVCDDCWDQLRGCPSTPHTPDIRSTFKRVLSHPISIFQLSPSPLSNSPLSVSPAVDTTILPPSLKRRSQPLHDVSNSSSLNTQSPGIDNSTGRINLRVSRTLPPDLERSYGELDTYPLRHCSLLCKATGGGRWEPKQIPVLDGYRQPIPGGKAPYEIQMEREEMLDRQRRENPVIKDGEFQYRFAKDPEPITITRSPHYISTF
ncbi:hypothetical protein BYT27DRAFT_7337900 [Phlegmacium glaucopus]|nr:hypothetical protein BYT27DRAFT_7337900 [Phlegmacium glaucopus]